MSITQHFFRSSHCSPGTGGGGAQLREAALPKATAKSGSRAGPARGPRPILTFRVQPRFLQVHPKATEAAEQAAAPSFPSPQSSLSGLRRDEDQQNPPVGSLPGLGEPEGIRTSPKPAQRCHNAATYGPRGHLHCHGDAAHHLSGLEGKEKSPYFNDIGELGFIPGSFIRPFKMLQMLRVMFSHRSS